MKKTKKHSRIKLILMMIIFAVVVFVGVFIFLMFSNKPYYSLNNFLLCNEPISLDDFDNLELTLTQFIRKISSLEELKIWLESQKCVKDVELIADGRPIIKTDPPQAEVKVEFIMNDGSTLTKVLDLFVENNKFEYNRMHD